MFGVVHFPNQNEMGSAYVSLSIIQMLQLIHPYHNLPKWKPHDNILQQMVRVSVPFIEIRTLMKENAYICIFLINQNTMLGQLFENVYNSAINYTIYTFLVCHELLLLVCTCVFQRGSVWPGIEQAQFINYHGI